MAFIWQLFAMLLSSLCSDMCACVAFDACPDGLPFSSSSSSFIDKALLSSIWVCWILAAALVSYCRYLVRGAPLLDCQKLRLAIRFVRLL